jgi:hypothetical protein
MPGKDGAIARSTAAIAAVLMISSLAPVAAQQSGTVGPQPQDQVPEQGPIARPDEPLSDKLSRSGGVIKPPANVDPEINVPAPNPNPNTTPVIPPPSMPGGPPGAQPK